MPLSMYSEINPASYCSVCIESFCAPPGLPRAKVESATGFFYRFEGQLFLITNWHVVTGRNLEKPYGLRNGVGDQPTSIRFCMPTKANKLQLSLLHPVPLYTNGTPNWLEINIEDHWDLVAIQITPPDDAHVVAVQDCSQSLRTVLEPGREVVIIGYPFGRLNGNPFPVWKKAMIASEPTLLYDDKPKFLLDTPGRPGMSGSPVYVAYEGFRFDQPYRSMEAAMDALMSEPQTGVTRNAVCLEFIGIYSGSVGDNNLTKLNLGVSWPSFIIDKILSEKTVGRNMKSPNPGEHPENNDWEMLHWHYMDEGGDEDC